MHHRVPIVAYAAAAVPETLGDAGLLLDAKDAVHRRRPPCIASSTDAELRAQLIEAGNRATARLRHRAVATQVARRDRARGRSDRRSSDDRPPVRPRRSSRARSVRTPWPCATCCARRATRPRSSRPRSIPSGPTAARTTAARRPSSRADVVVYQMAIGSVVADAVLARHEPLVVNHHNLTPMRYFHGWQPVAAHGVVVGPAPAPRVRQRAPRSASPSRVQRGTS